MRININNFKEAISKGTLNDSIDSIQLNIEDGKVKTAMINEGNDAIIFLNIENDIIDTDDEITFNFKEPKTNLIPYLNIMESEADLEIRREKMIISDGSQKAEIYFTSPTVVRTFSQSPREMDYFTEMDIDDYFIDCYKKIKKIGSRFGKVYFSVEDGRLIFETTDKTNPSANKLRFSIQEGVDKEGISMKFDYKTFVNMMEVINGSASDFRLKFAYVDEQEKGALVAAKNDDSEKYFLMSREEQR